MVARLLCPRISCTARRSAPPSSKWVAAECRKACGPVAAACGLYLARVDYSAPADMRADAEAELAPDDD